MEHDFFQGQRKIREIFDWSWKYGKDLKSHEKIMEFEIYGCDTSKHKGKRTENVLIQLKGKWIY